MTTGDKVYVQGYVDEIRKNIVIIRNRGGYFGTISDEIIEAAEWKHKATNDFTSDKKEWMDTITVNYIIAQSDGFQLGYAQALSDFTENIIDYWNGSDDKPQQSILDALVDLGVELGKRKQTVEKNIETAKSRGYERYYNWQYKHEDEPFSTTVGLFTKADTSEAEGAKE